MVKKLLKYEFTSLFKTLIPMEIILFGVALLTRFIQVFENDSSTFSVFMWSSVIMLIISMIVMLVMTVAVCTVRYYKNMFTAQGYLTLTLPVTHKAHIWAKLISSVTATLLSVISVILAFAVATAGEVLGETVKAAAYIVKKAAQYSKWNFPFYLLEVLLLVVLTTAFVYLLFYTCATIGQMAKKNRVLAAFGVFFGYYVIKQIIGTVFIICFVVFHKFFEELALMMAAKPQLYMHIGMCLLIVILAALCVLFFKICEHILKKKLNIE